MKIKQWFANRTIHAKLNLINGVVLLAAVLPIVCITLSYEYYSVRHSSLHEAGIQADIIRDNVAAAMAFADKESASEILLALRASPSVLQATLQLPDKEILAHYAKPGTAARPVTLEAELDEASVDWSTIRVSRQIFLKGNPVGWLLTETSLSPLYERLRLYLLVNFLSCLLGIAIAYPLSIRLKESITGPLSDLMAMARHVTTHQDYNPQQHTASSSNDEIGSLSRAFDNMLSNIRERDLKLSQMAYYDNVTGLTNRHYFMERLEQAVANTLRYGTRSCLIFIDLDDFKIVNDTHGHHVGDALLRAVSRHLSELLRDSDIVCRIGGDEFAVIIENIKDLKGPCILSRKIIDVLSRPMQVLEHEVVIGASLGISTCPDNAETMSDLLRTADMAMYQAKEKGKNRFCLYEPTIG